MNHVYNDSVAPFDPSICPFCIYKADQEDFVIRSLALVKELCNSPCVPLESFLLNENELKAFSRRYSPSFARFLIKHYDSMIRHSLLQSIDKIDNLELKLAIITKFIPSPYGYCLNSLNNIAYISKSDIEITTILMTHWQRFKISKEEHQDVISMYTFLLSKGLNNQIAVNEFQNFVKFIDFEHIIRLITSNRLDESFFICRQPLPFKNWDKFLAFYCQADLQWKNKASILINALSEEKLLYLAKCTPISNENISILLILCSLISDHVSLLQLLFNPQILNLSSRNFKDLITRLNCYTCLAYWAIQMMDQIAIWRDFWYLNFIIKIMMDKPHLKMLIYQFARQTNLKILKFLPPTSLDIFDKFNFVFPKDLPLAIQKTSLLTEPGQWEIWAELLSLFLHVERFGGLQLEQSVYFGEIQRRNPKFTQYFLNFYVLKKVKGSENMH